MKLLVKLLLEFAPLVLFFIVSTKFGVFVGTGVLMLGTVVSLALTWWLFQQVAMMAIITALTGLIAGGLTLVFHEEFYVKLKPTIVSLVFAGILITGQIMRKPLFKALLGQNLHLTDEGWRLLTWLWIGYFLFITGLNEYIWRNYSTEFWLAFKAFGLIPITLAYALPQILLLRRYRLPDAEPLFGRSSPELNTGAVKASAQPARQPI